MQIDLVRILTVSLAFIGIIGVIFGLGLAIAAAKFAVKVDPKVERVREVLPGANCGACGYAGCQGYAEAVAANPEVPPNLCAPGKAAVAEAIAQITGKTAAAVEPKVARIFCQGDSARSVKRFRYEGIKDCRAAVLAGGGDKACAYGCLGYGTCASVCPFGAITMNEYDLPVVDVEKCTGCRKCEIACPKKVIEVLPISKQVLVRCHSLDSGPVTRKNCQVGCIACGSCVKVCPFEAVSLNNNLARIDIEKCRRCGLCVMKCPTNAIMDYIPHRTKAYITDKCNGCTICAKVCPVNAASGVLKQKHVIDQERCIGCGICVDKCPKKAIIGTFNAETMDISEILEEAKKV